MGLLCVWFWNVRHHQSQFVFGTSFVFSVKLKTATPGALQGSFSFNKLSSHKSSSKVFVIKAYKVCTFIYYHKVIAFKPLVPINDRLLKFHPFLVAVAAGQLLLWLKCTSLPLAAPVVACTAFSADNIVGCFYSELLFCESPLLFIVRHWAFNIVGFGFLA